MDMLFSLVLLLAAYLPFQVALNPAPGVDLASIRVLILGVFLLWLAKGLRDRKIKLAHSFQTGFLVLFLFLNFFSLFFARNVDWSLRKLAFLFSIFPIYFVVASVVTNKSAFKKVAAWLVVSGMAVAMLGILQFSAQFWLGIDRLYLLWAKYVAVIFLGETFSQAVFAHPSWLVNVSGHTYFRAIAIFPDPHMFALFLGLLLPLALALFFEQKKKLWLVCAGTIFLADLLTFSRGGYLGLLGGTLALGLVFQRHLVRKYKIAFLLGMLFLALAMIIPGPISSRFFSSFDATEGSNVGRLFMWQKAAETILEHPTHGVGIGNFPLTVSPLATYREPIYAHNTYLDVAAEAGLLTAIAWSGVLFFAVRSFMKKAPEDKLYLGAAMSLIIFAVHSVVETGLYSPVVLTLVLMIIAFSNIPENYAPIL